MKKVLAIVAVSAMCLAANAQKFADRQVMAPSNMEKASLFSQKRVYKNQGMLNREVAPSSLMTKANAFQTKKNVVSKETGVEVLYFNPDNCLYDGLYPNFMGAYVPQVITPAWKDVTWWNYCNDGKTLMADVTWSCKNGDREIEASVDEKHNYTAQVWGYVNTPVLTFTPDGTSYNYGLPEQDNPSLKPYVGKGYWTGGMAEMSWIGNAEVTAQGVYSGFGKDPATGRYITFTSKEVFYGKTQNCIGFAEYLGDPGEILYVDSLTMMCGFADYKTLDAADPLNGQTLYADIYEVVDGVVQEEPLATAVATSENVYSIAEWEMTSISFAFVEEDELFGNVAAPVVLQPGKDYFIELTGFENVKQPITAIFAPDAGTGGNAYAILEDGSLGTVGYSNAPNTPAGNFAISLHAIMPTASIDPMMPKAIQFPAEGGVANTYEYNGDMMQDFDIATLNGVADWTYEAPEWVKISADEQYLNTQGYLLLFFEAEALPAGMDGRGGEIVLSLYGKDYVIPVGQGNYDGIQGVVADKNESKSNVSYNLLGQRVAANAKGVVVRGGKKLLQK